MSSKFKLSLPTAVFININIILSSGIFINLLPLAQISGLLGAAIYAVIGLLMFPIVLVVSKLLNRYPGGSFYTFAANEINEFAGFISAWTYFTGKLASATLLIHFFTLIIQSLIPITSAVPTLVIDAIIISAFAYLNMQNLKVGSIIQYFFIFFKAVPILFIILAGMFLYNPGNLSSEFILWKGVFSVVPLVIFAFAGFEAAASLSRHIENPDRNAPLAVLISFGIVVLISVLANFFFFILLGSDLANAGNYFEALPILINKIFPMSGVIKFKLIALLQLAVGCSALGGAYGILFSNCWNLYTLAEKKHVFFSNFFIRLNKFEIPIYCILVEALFCFFYLVITNGDNIPLQQIGAFGNICAYTISVFSLLIASLNKKANSLYLCLIAILNCFILLFVCFRQLVLTGGVQFIIFLLILTFGMAMFFCEKYKADYLP